MGDFYSKHIFIASFKLENNSRDIISDNVWKEDFIDDVNTVGELVDNYANYNYFNKQARNLIFNYEKNNPDKGDSKVVNYKFSPEDLNGDFKYIINVNKEKTYELNIDKIILKEYEIANKKIYLMMIYVTNNDYDSLSDIKNINQYGRRLYSPWIPLDLGNGINTECPDDLQIHIGEKFIYSNDKNDGKADLNYKDEEIFKYNFDKNRNIKSMKSGDRQVEFITELNDDVEFRKSLNRFRKLGVIK